MPDTKINILMVCLGNICRSPTAEVIFRQQVEEYNLQDFIQIDSAGTGDWHIGHSPDTRATSAAAKRDLDLSPLRARLVKSEDFDAFDYIFAMDKDNFKNLCAMAPVTHQHKVSLFLTHADGSPTMGYDEVPDPYYVGEAGFELVLDLITEASTKILKLIAQQHQLN